MEVTVLLALRGELEAAVVAAADGRRDVVVTRRCADLAEVLAAALAGLGGVAVIDAALEPETALVARLARAGVATVVVAPTVQHARYDGYGVPLVTPDGGPEAVLAAAAGAGVSAAEADTDPGGIPVLPPAPREPGRLIAVTGPGGAPGRTTVAVNVAVELAGLGTRVRLVDADVWGAAVGPMLGVTEESAGLAAAVRAADRGTLDGATLRRLLQGVAGLEVLAGPTRPGRWREVASPSLAGVLEVARQGVDWLVVDAPAPVPGEDPGGFESFGPGRNGVLEAVLEAADEVLIVGAGEPLGIERLVQLVLDLEPGPARRRVLVNRIRAAAAGPRPEESVREALARFAGVTDPVLVPDDRSACDRALLSGAALAEVAPRSPARVALRALAVDLTGRDVPGRRRDLSAILRRRNGGRVSLGG